MKVSLMLAASASLAGATPLRVRQSPSLRPFLQPDASSSLQNCGNPLFLGNTDDKSEACVGTLEYCQRGFYSQFGERFGSAAECVAAREPAPRKPFREPDFSIRSCGNPLSGANTLDQSEACVGTLSYCQKGLYAEFGETFASGEACMDSREDPGLKPFKQPNFNSLASCGNPLFLGNTEGQSEACVGTVIYCRKGLWAKYKEETFGSEDECLRSRNPAPGAPKHSPVSSKPAPEPTPEPKPEPTSKSVSESVAEPTLKPTPEPVPETTSKTTSVSVSEVPSKPTSQTVSETTSKTTSVSEVPSKPTSQSVSETASKPTSKTVSETTSKPTSKTVSVSVSEVTSKPTAQTVSEIVSKTSSASTPKLSTPSSAPTPSAKPESTSTPTSQLSSEPTPEATPEPAPVQACIPPKAPAVDEDRWIWS